MGELKTHLSNQLEAAGMKAHYDTNAKKILGDKDILARIIKAVADEFSDVSIEDIKACLEAEPSISSVPVFPSRRVTSAVTGIATEDKVPNEGDLYYDLRTFCRIVAKKLKIFFNIEIQNDFYPGYSFVNRGTVYGARQISSQIGTEFDIPNYDDVKKVYSIWICTDCPADAQNTITKFSMKREDVYGHYEKFPDGDLMTVIIICLGKGKNRGKGTPLHHLLETLFAPDLTPTQKEDILENNFGITQTIKRKELLTQMCNLSEGIQRQGALNLLKNLFANGASFDLVKKSAPEFSEAELIAIQEEVEAERATQE